MSAYMVVIERAEDGGWGAYPPDMPGSSRSAPPATRFLRIREALDAYALEMAALGQALPDSIATSETIQAA